jgi:SHS family lactate transporter-like MFS transporter
MTCISMIGAIIGGILVGMYSDRIGRRRAIAFALLGAIVAVPFWAFAPSVPLLVAGAFLLQLFVQGAWGVIPAHITELSPNTVRGLLPGFAYQCGILLAGTITTVEAALAERMSYAWAMATVAVLSFSLAVTAALLGREEKGVEYGSKL